MSDRTVRRFVDALLRGRAAERARPDQFEAAQMAAAIELRAARTGSDSPSEEFVTELHRRLAENMSADAGSISSRPQRALAGTRRQVVLGTGIAAASAATGIVVGRNLLMPNLGGVPAADQGTVEPNSGTWRAVDVDVPSGGVLAFDLGSLSGFVHRDDAGLEAVSGVCTHQGCKLWLDAPERRLRCPCHSTSFALDGRTMTHQLPTAPPPLPRIEVREMNGRIEVFAPPELD